MGEKYRPIDSLMNYATYKNSYCLQVKKKYLHYTAHRTLLFKDQRRAVWFLVRYAIQYALI